MKFEIDWCSWCLEPDYIQLMVGLIIALVLWTAGTIIIACDIEWAFWHPCCSIFGHEKNFQLLATLMFVVFAQGSILGTYHGHRYQTRDNIQFFVVNRMDLFRNNGKNRIFHPHAFRFCTNVNAILWRNICSKYTKYGIVWVLKYCRYRNYWGPH